MTRGDLSQDDVMRDTKDGMKRMAAFLKKYSC